MGEVYTQALHDEFSELVAREALGTITAGETGRLDKLQDIRRTNDYAIQEETTVDRQQHRRVRVFERKKLKESDLRVTRVETGQGWFHQWGQDFEDFGQEHGPANYTVAIVELDNGTVDTFMPGMIEFVNEDAA
jgi:hypothetical protein